MALIADVDGSADDIGDASDLQDDGSEVKKSEEPDETSI